MNLTDEHKTYLTQTIENITYALERKTEIIDALQVLKMYEFAMPHNTTYHPHEAIFTTLRATCGNFFGLLSYIKTTDYGVEIDPKRFNCPPAFKCYICIKYAMVNPTGEREDQFAQFPVNTGDEFDDECFDSDGNYCPSFWLNEKRWKFLEFALAECKKFAETGTLEPLG
ncbi:hypothetical protein HYP67_gp063 [Acinetobacter phage vB_ApiM_fHyAci03]|uniref:Uncharacterized protein n=1 Tax=Acinetobacter phage vB_ApiM_fHyAci03 TaxID=2269366 RepID=A0A345AUP9_9CAUD|nr:hypothetical protein HYP67_gp063 [Acinetobacter phage vB_ApiM_fHyAci03]AXF40632.1 hypothetical protein Ac3_063 [Acinetobacter phage vB_ApiM_fHyAci03]